MYKKTKEILVVKITLKDLKDVKPLNENWCEIRHVTTTKRINLIVSFIYSTHDGFIDIFVFLRKHTT